MSLSAAEHWNRLANEAESFAEYEESRGHLGEVYRHKAATYRRTVVALLMEHESGISHCVDHLLPTDQFGCCPVTRR